MEQGKQVVELARTTLDSFVETGKYRKGARTDPYLAEKRGVFVTLNVVEEGGSMLRGCIGFPYPVKPLVDAIQEAAVLAASDDPRFNPVTPEELQTIVVEVSVLTLPVELRVKNRKELPSKVRIGEDGLMISTSFAGGLLLPQVATEQRWGAEEFLNQACLKAGVSPDSWLLPQTKVQVFQADIFAEKTPRGEVEQVALPVI
jgi:uncharacterized protein (TIGR00296 family)